MAITSIDQSYADGDAYYPDLSRQNAGRLRRQLALGASQLTRILTRKQPSTPETHDRSDSGTAGLRLQNPIQGGSMSYRQIKQGLLSTIGSQDFLATTGHRSLRHSLIDEFPRTVDLLELCAGLLPEPGVQMVLGRDQDDKPLVYDLANENMGNILISGESTAGKSALMRTMATSLALVNRQSQVQMAMVSMPSRHSGFFRRPDLIKPLTYLPHLLFPVITTAEESFEVLQFLTDEVTYREEMDLDWPLLVLFIDNVDRLIEAGDYGVTSLLRRLIEVSPRAGLRLILSATDPDSGELAQILRHNVSHHLTGRTNLPQLYGRTPSSNHLSGQGDFLARSFGPPRRFQAAFIDDYDLQLTLEDLYGQASKVLLARTVASSDQAAPPLTGELDSPFSSHMNQDSMRVDLEQELHFESPISGSEPTEANQNAQLDLDVELASNIGLRNQTSNHPVEENSPMNRHQEDQGELEYVSLDDE